MLSFMKKLVHMSERHEPEKKSRIQPAQGWSWVQGARKSLARAVGIVARAAQSRSNGDEVGGIEPAHGWSWGRAVSAEIQVATKTKSCPIPMVRSFLFEKAIA